MFACLMQSISLFYVVTYSMKEEVNQTNDTLAVVLLFFFPAEFFYVLLLVNQNV